jgi:transcription elongation factor Elf1
MTNVNKVLTVDCPRCGKVSSYTKSVSQNQNSGVVVSCKSCGKNFTIDIRKGEVFRSR